MGLAAAGAIAGIAGGVAGVANAAGSLIGGGKAAAGAQQSQQLQQQQMAQNAANMAPFIQAGQQAVQQMPGAVGVPMDLSGMPTAPTSPGAFQWNPTMAGLAATPGYQFALQQGQQAVQSAAAARGLGVSGAALQGAANYATGLASQTYNQQLSNALNQYQAGLNLYQLQNQGYNTALGGYQNLFNNYWANNQNRFGQLQNIASLGVNAAGNQATTSTTAAGNVGNAALAGGQIQGASTQGALNSLAGTLNSPTTQNALSGLFGSNNAVSPSAALLNQTYENQQFAQQPAGTYGPFL